MAMPLATLSTLPTDVLLGTGYLFRANTFQGISRGGLRFEPSVEKRNIPFDGKMADVDQLDWDTFSGAIITGTFIQFVGQLATYEPGSTSASGSSPVTTIITPKKSGLLYAAADYITNLRLVWPTTAGGFVQVRFPKAMCTQYNLAGQDRQEMEIQATFAARSPLATAAGSNPGTKPYVIEKLSAFS
jgi:hypothetical protein